MPERLPTPGGDDGNWGTVLNQFLSVAHKSDGTLKAVPSSGTNPDRDTSSAIQIATMANGTIVPMAGLLYEVDNTATGTKSATNDLGVNGLKPFGRVMPDHFGTDAIQRALDWMNLNGGGVVYLKPKTYSLNTGSTYGIYIKRGVTLDARGATLKGTGGTGAVVQIGGTNSVFNGGLLGGTILQGSLSVRIGLLLTGNCRAASVDGTEIAGNFTVAQVKLEAKAGEICYFNNLTNIYTRYIPKTKGAPVRKGISILLEGTTSGSEGWVNRNTISADTNKGNIGLYLSTNASTNKCYFSNQNAVTGIKVGSGNKSDGNDCNFNQIIGAIIEKAGKTAVVSFPAKGTLFLGGNLAMTSTSFLDTGDGTMQYTAANDFTMHAGSTTTFSGRVRLEGRAEQRIGFFSMAKNRYYEIISWGAIDAVSDSNRFLNMRIETNKSTSIDEWRDSGKTYRRGPNPIKRVSAGSNSNGNKRDIVLRNNNANGKDVDYFIKVRIAGG